MLDSQGRLEILNQILIDYTLPKYKEITAQELDEVTKFEDDEGESGMAPENEEGRKKRAHRIARRARAWRSMRSNIIQFTPSEDDEVMTNLTADSLPSSPLRITARPTATTLQVTLRAPEDGFFKRVWKAITFQKPAPIAELSVFEFFSHVKNSVKELDLITERANGYALAIQNATAAGQTALVEQLKENFIACRLEAQMASAGVNQYLDEEPVVTFYKTTEKGLRLDYIANFTRTIPEEVVKKKLRADELEIFDNYCVLHFDPKAKAFALTKRQVEAKRDPILFGLLVGRRRLYYIGDWIDEVCDLTLDQLADKLGRSKEALLHVADPLKPT